MINNSSDSNTDLVDFSRFYTGEPDAAHLDSSNRETEEWQFDGVIETQCPVSSADNIHWNAPAQTLEDGQTDGETELETELETESDRTNDPATFGLSCREVGEWQYIHPDAAAVTRKFYEDCAGGLLHPSHSTALSPLQEELAKWLPST